MYRGGAFVHKGDAPAQLRPKGDASASDKAAPLRHRGGACVVKRWRLCVEEALIWFTSVLLMAENLSFGSLGCVSLL